MFSRRGLLIKGVFQFGQFPSIWAFRSRRQEPALFYKSHRFFIQFSACSGHDRFVKFNRRGGANKQRGGGKIILKLIDGGARLLETPEYSAVLFWKKNICLFNCL